MKANRFLLIVLGFFSITSCDPCKDERPTPSHIALSLVDSNGDDLIVSTYNQAGYPYIKYHAASPKRNSDEGFRTLWLPYASFVSGKNYYLQLSPEEVDTFVIDYTQTKLKCYTDFNLNQFLYNNKPFNFYKGNEIRAEK